MHKKKLKQKSTKQLKSLPFQWIILIGIIVILALIFVGNKYINHLQQSSNRFIPPVTVNSHQIAVNPTTIPTPTITTLDSTKFQLDTSTWQSFYDNTFDFSIKYPSSWTLTATDQKQGFYGAYGFGCGDLANLLRDPNSCTVSTANHTMILSGPNNGNVEGSQIYMYIFTSAAGGGSVDTILPIDINGSQYTLNMSYYTSENNGGNGSGYAGDIFNALPITGQKSIWGKVHLHFSISEKDLPVLINILESIKS